MNCDVRDFSILNDAGMFVRDGDWKDVARVEAGRFNCKLKPFTLQCITGLNFEPCAKNELAAWTQAYGVAVGILPAVNSRLTSEILYTTEFPARDSRSAITKFEKLNSVDLFPTAMNIIVMFGLFHLNKDHTYRTRDSNMERIWKSYVNTLRTLPNSGFIEGILNNLEPIVRTAPHPLGLAQCYYVAQQSMVDVSTLEGSQEAGQFVEG
ncbi:hypothetical protein FRX31_033971 [Thalictrum thalictroides]|uniref:Uncharacterized protein n=1 Tax=Thalictrum thalictroides TaxID=46969 RepID=A0A7J6UW88_THATH|nr:hypothetical protein FRX31_033971 [Thalictrum thalictroides]